MSIAGSNIFTAAEQLQFMGVTRPLNNSPCSEISDNLIQLNNPSTNQIPGIYPPRDNLTPVSLIDFGGGRGFRSNMSTGRSDVYFRHHGVDVASDGSVSTEVDFGRPSPRFNNAGTGYPITTDILGNTNRATPHTNPNHAFTPIRNVYTNQDHVPDYHGLNIPQTPVPNNMEWERLRNSTPVDQFPLLDGVGQSQYGCTPYNNKTGNIPNLRTRNNMVSDPYHINGFDPQPGLIGGFPVQNAKSSVPKRRERTIDTFDGRNAEWPDYLLQFQMAADMNGWSERERVQQMLLSLRGQARMLLSGINMNVLPSFEKLCFILSQRYNPREREVARRCEYRNRRRRTGESASDYGYGLQRLFQQAYPYESHSSSSLIDQFIQGIGDFEIQKHVQFHHPKTLEQAIAFATEFEAFTQPDGRLMKPKPESCFLTNPACDSQDLRKRNSYPKQNNNRRDKVYCKFCHLTGHTLSDCFSLQRELKKDTQNKASEPTVPIETNIKKSEN